MRTRGESFKKRTSPDSFRRLRSLSADDPGWEGLRDQIFEENMGLAYYAVDREGRRLLHALSGEEREQAREDLLQLAFQELTRVIPAYDPDRPNPRDPSKPVEFATFALASLLPKVRDQCRREAEYRLNLAHSVTAYDEEEDEFSLDDLPAEPSAEEVAREREMRIDGRLGRIDPALAGRIRGILDKLWGGDGVTVFERQLLFKLIADPSVVLARVKRQGATSGALSESFEPLPLRRHRRWRQVLD